MATSLNEALPISWSRGRAHIGDFWSWWTSELWALTPSLVRRLLGPEGPRLVIDLASGRVDYYAANARKDGEHLGELVLDAESPAALREALGALLQKRSRRRLGLALTLPNILSREIELPPMAGGDLKAALRLDMDRQMPFSADEVLFTHRVIGRDPARSKVTVALTVLPKEACEQPKVLAKALGLPLVYLGAPSDTHPACPKWDDNLWRSPSSRGAAIATRILLIGMVLLSALALWLPLERDRQEAAAVASRLSEVQMREAALRVEREELSRFLAAAETMSRMEAMGLPLLADISASLTDDTELDRLDWRDGRVEIAGRAGASSAIVARLNALPRFKTVGYLSPVTRDGEGRERFNLALEIASEDER